MEILKGHCGAVVFPRLAGDHPYHVREAHEIVLAIHKRRHLIGSAWREKVRGNKEIELFPRKPEECSGCLFVREASAVPCDFIDGRQMQDRVSVTETRDVLPSRDALVRDRVDNAFGTHAKPPCGLCGTEPLALGSDDWSTPDIGAIELAPDDLAELFSEVRIGLTLKAHEPLIPAAETCRRGRRTIGAV